MSALDHHLVRRSIDVAHQATVLFDGNKPTGDHDGEPEGDGKAIFKSPTAAVILVISTIVLVGAALAVQYTYGLVVATLAAVEDPQPDIYIAVDATDSVDAPVDDASARKPGKDNTPRIVHADVYDAQPQPVTGSLRTTIQHLRARAGRWSRFRGLSLFIAWNMCRSALVGLFSFGLPSIITRSVADIAAEVALGSVAVAWIHTVISEPTSKAWWRRIPGYQTWKKVAPAVALKAVATQACVLLPVFLAMALDLFELTKDFSPSEADPSTPSPAILGGALGVLILSLGLVVLVEIPASVVMVRVAASLLPDSVDTIVPFDRSFGGKVTPTVVGGSGKIGLLDAWTTFSGAARIRLMKILVKVFAMLTTLMFSLITIYVSVLVLVSKKAI